MDASNVISVAAVVISVVSLWYSRRRYRHERTMEFEQRKREIRTLLIETDLFNQKIDVILVKLRMLKPLNDRMKAFTDKLTKEQPDAEEHTRILNEAFETIGHTSDGTVHVELEELFNKVQRNHGETKKNLGYMESLLELERQRITDTSS